MENDNKLKKLFSDFDPELSSDRMFFQRLERSLNSVEILKKRSEEIELKYKKAVAIAVAIGFLAGFLFSLLLPSLQGAVAVWRQTMPDSTWMTMTADNILLIGWMMVAAISSVIAHNAYEVSLVFLKAEDSETLRE